MAIFNSYVSLPDGTSLHSSPSKAIGSKLSRLFIFHFFQESQGHYGLSVDAVAECQDIPLVSQITHQDTTFIAEFGIIW